MKARPWTMMTCAYPPAFPPPPKPWFCSKRLHDHTRNLESGPLFPYSSGWLYTLIRDAADRCGLYQEFQQRGLRLSPHSLRHAFATHRYENGMDFAVVYHLLGHTQANDTVIYLSSARGQLQAAYDRCNPFAAPRRLELPDHQPLPPSEYPSQQERGREFARQPQAARLNGLPAVPTPLEVERVLQVAPPVCASSFACSTPAVAGRSS